MECQWKSNLLWNEWISELTLPLTVRYTTRKRKRACLSRREIGKRSDRHCTGNGCSGYEFSGPNLLTVHCCQLTKIKENDPIILSLVSCSWDILISFQGILRCYTRSEQTYVDVQIDKPAQWILIHWINVRHIRYGEEQHATMSRHLKQINNIPAIQATFAVDSCNHFEKWLLLDMLEIC